MSNARFSILQARAVKDKRISDAQFRTLAALGMYADEDGWCFPRQTTIGNDLQKSRQAVNRDIQALKELGYLEVRPQYREDGSQTVNLYRLKYDLPPMGGETPALQGVKLNTVTGGETPEGDSINDPINDPKEDIDSQIFTSLSELTGGSLNTDTPRHVDTWKEKHTIEWILKAIDVPKSKGIRGSGVVKYVDSILIGWEANGYPKTREQQVQDRKAQPKPAQSSKGQSMSAIWAQAEAEGLI